MTMRESNNNIISPNHYTSEKGFEVFDVKDEMKYYQVAGFGDAGPIFWFTVTAENFREALREISKDYYMTDMDFCKLEITEVEE